VRVDAVYNRVDGDPLALAVMASALRDADGGVAGVVMIVQEKT
jgi:hypothetical protein